MDIHEGFRLLETDEPTYNYVLERFDGYFNPRRNTVYEQFLLFQVKQQADQCVDDFVLTLKTQTGPCEFHSDERDKLIRDRLVAGIVDAESRVELLRTNDLTLEKALDLSRIYEASKKQSLAMSSVDSSQALPLDSLRQIGLEFYSAVLSSILSFNKIRPK